MTIKPHIALIHPPASTTRMYQLDGYCSQPQKGPFRWHPLDFVAFAAKLSDHARVTIHDLGTSAKITKKIKHPPDAIIGLAGAYGWKTHENFWQQVTSQGHNVFLTGDICRHDPDFVFSRLPDIAGIIPELACCPSVEELLENRGNFIWQSKSAHILPQPGHGFKTGIQDYNFWNKQMYKLPFAPGKRFASVFSQIGCPFACSYCILSSYPFASRNMEEFEEEVFSLKKQGVEHIYIRDATFNSCPKHIKNVCDVMKRLKLPWNTFARLGNLAEISPLLAESGCKLVQIGFDSPDKKTLEMYDKKIKADPHKEVAALHENGIKVVGHFVLGLDEKNDETAENILTYSQQLKLEWITVTPLMIRPGTKLWKTELTESLEKNFPVVEKTVDGIMKKFYFSVNGFKTLAPVVFKDLSIMKFAVNKALALTLKVHK